uniref:Uncharacterized protein n=1 Tax=Paramormyrops kingsleyae TaxID=1676925 RepID=A0A3B3S4J4_9TELE
QLQHPVSPLRRLGSLPSPRTLSKQQHRDPSETLGEPHSCSSSAGLRVAILSCLPKTDWRLTSSPQAGRALRCRVTAPLFVWATLCLLLLFWGGHREWESHPAPHSNTLPM